MYAFACVLYPLFCNKLKYEQQSLVIKDLEQTTSENPTATLTNYKTQAISAN